MIIFEIHQILDFKCVTWFQDTLMIAYDKNMIYFTLLTL